MESELETKLLKEIEKVFNQKSYNLQVAENEYIYYDQLFQMKPTEDILKQLITEATKISAIQVSY